MTNFSALENRKYFKDDVKFYRSENGYVFNEFLGGPVAMENITKTYKAEKDDIIVTSFPKTGTTWLQEIVYLIATDLDLESANKVKINDRFPYIEFVRPKPPDLSKIYTPRFFKTHYPYSLLPKSAIEKKCKILVSIRNPKDTLVSYYFFTKHAVSMGFDGELSQFVDCFLNDEVVYCPYWKHVLEYWERRHDENVFIVTYEEMQKDIADVIRKIAKFLGKELSEGDVQRVVEHCSFNNMKTSTSVVPPIPKSQSCGDKAHFNPLMRKGKVGDWKNHLTEEMNKKVDLYIEKYFKDSDLEFIYEL